MASSSTNVKELLSLDPYSIKSALVNLLTTRLGVNADALEASFSGYLTQALTLVSSDTLSSLAFSYNEAFTQKCSLISTAHDLAVMFDYDTPTATPCTGTLSIQIAYPTTSGEVYKTEIPNGTICSSSDIQYLVNGTYTISISENKCSIKRKDSDTGIITDVSFNTVVKNSQKFLSFTVDIRQIKIFEHDFTFTDVTYNKFYDVSISGFEDSVYDMNIGVYITQENENFSQFVKFKKITNIYSASPTDKVYTFTLGKNNTATVRFGNGIFGYQPDEGQEGKIIIYTTMGNDGSVIENSLTLKNNLKDSISNLTLNVSSTNLSSINNGQNEESLTDLKNNIIDQISTAKRFVTQSDYEKFKSVTGINDITMYPLLLRRDTNANEIDLFSVMYGNDGKPVPTTSISAMFTVVTEPLMKTKVYRRYFTKGLKATIYDAYTSIPTVLVAGKKYYIDDDYSVVGTAWSNHGGEMATYQSGGTWAFTELSDDNKLAYVCPFNIIVDGTYYKRAHYEYIPSKLTLNPAISFQTVNSGIELTFNDTLINVLPENAIEYEGLEVTHFTMIHNLDYSSSMNVNDIECITKIESSEVTPSISQTYNFRPFSNDEVDDVIEFSYNIPIADIPFIDWETTNTEITNPNILTITTTLKYMDQVYNTYQRKVILRSGEENGIDETYLNTKLGYVYSINDSMTMKQTVPNIEKIDLGINTVLFNWMTWQDSDGNDVDGYEMIVYIYKLDTNDAARIRCSLNIAGVAYSSYTYGVGGNGTLMVFKFHIPYDRDAIDTGSLPYTLYFTYDYKNNGNFGQFSTYTGNVIARQVLNNTMWSTVRYIKDNDYGSSRFKIYKIPVIEKSYYDTHADEVEARMLYTMATVDYNFSEYKMLTDSVNIKYANTTGLTEDLKYNSIENTNDLLIYKDWMWDIPPTISARIIIDNSSLNGKTVKEIEENCKNVIFAFLTMKTSGFAKSIIRSELVRYIHDTVPEVLSCEIILPERDIIYNYDEDTLPKDKDLLLSYVPEFVWIDIDKISISTINISK